MSVGPVTVSPLAGRAVHLRSMSGSEELGRLYEYELELLSPDPSIGLAEALGQNLTVSLELTDGGVRCFNGYVSRFSFTGTSGNAAVYRATLRPWLWFLTRTADCRIFNQRSVPDIIKAVFRHYPQALFDGPLPGYAARDYVVQYRETDFNFVSRLMEEAGIYYFFRHEAGKHTLVFADSIGGHDKYPGGPLPYLAPTSSGRHAADHFDGWRVSQEIQTAGYVMKDYDFAKPRGDLLSAIRPQGGHPRTVMGERFDYPGRYAERAAGDAMAGVRLDEIYTEYEVADAQGTTRALGVGQTFRLTDLPRPDQNREYAVVRAHYEIRSHDPESTGQGAGQGDGGGAEAEVFRASYALLPVSQPFRPARRTPRPTVQGPQTAVVVGDKKTQPDATEIHTDPNGRVRVRFFWERLGAERPGDKNDDETKNEDLTCWVRVSQVWAGAQWGAIHIPRIGQEVIVDFLEGDPDRPIITGRVYNADNMPPYELPANKTQSGIKSRSTPGAGPSNFNEIRFEDKKGAEELHVQAERDHSTLVKNNQSLSVGADRSVSVTGNESITVQGTRSSTITQKETQTFNDARSMTVAKTDDVEITGPHTGKYHAGRTETVESGDSLEVMGANKTVTVHGEYNTVADAQFQVDQGANKILVKDAVTIQSVGDIKITNGPCTIDLRGGVAAIDAAEEIVFTCGGTSLSLRSDGTVEIFGAQKVTAAGGGSGVELVAAGATVSGTKATIAGAATAEVLAAIVKIN